MLKKNYKVGIIGLGYVGKPLFEQIFNKKIKVVGYDKSLDRINYIKKTRKKYHHLISNNSSILSNCNIYLVCVPTPVNKQKKPDLKPLRNACLTIAKYIKNKNIIIFESTVYPGVTRKFCLPILKKNYQNKKNLFYVGYAPERLSPGDSKKITNITKIVASDNENIGQEIKKFYKHFINNVYLVKSIEIAELAKNFENCQRDVNISLMNELYILCEKVGINPYDVIKACKTKWNFGNYYPGLVGGHCISVDPYYLIEFAKEKKILLKTLITSRKVNEQFIINIKNKIIKYLVKNKIKKVTKFYLLEERIKKI